MSKKHHRSICFHLAQEGKPPFRVTAEILKKMAVMREITGDDLLYSKNLGTWTKARNVKGLRTFFSQLEKTSNNQPLNTKEESTTHSIDRNIPNVNTKTLDKSSIDPLFTHALAKKMIVIPSQKPHVHSNGQTTKYISWIDSTPYITALAVAAVTMIASIGAIYWFRATNHETIITGIVSYNRMPILDGEIVFDTASFDSSELKSEIINGSYYIACKDRNVSGAKTVRVFGYRKPKTRQIAVNQYKEKSSPDFANYIAKEHNSSSTNSVTVAPGVTNTFDFHLTGK